jgi:hypothetical protein
VESGSGRWQDSVARRGEASAVRESGGARAEAARGSAQSGAGAAVRGTWPAQATGMAQRRNRGAGAGGGRRGLIYDFPKVQGPHCNVLVTFKP